MLTANAITKSSTLSVLCIAHGETTSEATADERTFSRAALRRRRMIGTTSKLALALGVVGAIALSIPAAEARTKRSAPQAQQTITGNPFAYQAPVYQTPSYRGSYNLYGGNGYSGGGINFNDGRGGANYNPNQ
jgi:hypothetical protein